MVDQDLAQLPLFRELPPAAVEALGVEAIRHEFPSGTAIIREGDLAQSMYFLSQGNVRVERGTPPEPIGVLGAPTLFGEMALVAETPRLASVVADSPCTVFELQRSAVFAVAQMHPIMRDTILAFHHDRLMQNLLASSPLFEPIGQDRKRALAAAFQTRTLDGDQVLLEEGKSGTGLYILLRGRCEVWRGEQKVADLAEGDVFGEISMVLFEQPCTATVKTGTDSVVLQLSRQDFQNIVMANPELRARIMKLALSRLRENKSSDVKSSRASLL